MTAETAEEPAASLVGEAGSDRADILIWAHVEYTISTGPSVDVLPSREGVMIISHLFNLFWRFIFFWKRRTGWLDRGQEIQITGTVIQVGPKDFDGDRNFDVELDAGQEKWITGFGGRLTSGADDDRPSMHCEIPPWALSELRATYDRVRVGDRVRVSGSWGFDGVHTGRKEVVEVLLAIVRHQPNVRGGWFEIHPVVDLEIG